MDSVEYNREIGKVIAQLTAAIQNVGMYPHDHPLISSPIRDAYNGLEALLKTKQGIAIILVGGYLLIDNRPLVLAGTYETAFVRILKQCSIERINFLRGLSLVELEELVRQLASADVSAMRSSPNIKTGKLIKRKDGEQDGTAEDSDLEFSEGEPGETLDLGFSGDETGEAPDLGFDIPGQDIRDIYQKLMKQKDVHPDRVQEIVLYFMENMRKTMNPLKLLAEIKSNDEYTFTHAANVGILSMFLAEDLGFEGSQLTEIGIAAILHDVGKITIPDEILSKPGQLTSEERAVMESHPVMGAMRLMEMKGISALAVICAMEHHIRFDGSGYPQIKGGWKTNIVSQIISVADVYDAVRTNRPYRESMPQDKIVQIFIRESGTTFNPVIAKRFLHLIEKSSP